MLIAEDLCAIGERANQELNAVHDFYEHSKFVWQSFQTFVDAENKVVAENQATGSRIDQDGLIGLAPQYTRKYLATFTFRQFVSTFEVFLFAFLHRLLLHNPWQFSQKQLDFGTVLKAASRDEVISEMILKQLNELKYEPLREWFAALNRTMKLDGLMEDEVERLSEVKATRNILEHNAGVVNETYCRKAGKKARYRAGKRS